MFVQIVACNSCEPVPWSEAWLANSYGQWAGCLTIMPASFFRRNSAPHTVAMFLFDGILPACPWFVSRGVMPPGAFPYTKQTRAPWIRCPGGDHAAFFV